MIVIRFLRWLFGYVQFMGVSVNPEMFINMISGEGINIWNTQIKGGQIQAFIAKSQYRKLRPIAFKSVTRIRVSKKVGFPFLISSLKKRKGLIIGAAVFVITIALMSQYIWVIEINPNKATDLGKIKALMGKSGLCTGVRAKSLDVQRIEQQLMLALPEVAWISINVTGSVAQVELSISEPTPQMHLIDRDDTSVLIAGREGQVVRNEVYSGTTMVGVGEVIEKGQLLVNSNIETEQGEIIQTGAHGKVFARTRENIGIEVPFDRVVQIPQEEKVIRRKLSFFNIGIPLSLSAIPEQNASVCVREREATLLKRKLPMSITEETWTVFEDRQVHLSEEEALDKARCILNSKLKDKVSENEAKILSCDETITSGEDKISLSVSVLSEENVAVRNNESSQDGQS